MSSTPDPRTEAPGVQAAGPPMRPGEARVPQGAPGVPPGAAPVVPPDAAVRVLRQFRIVFNAVKSHFRQVEKRAGIGGAQLWALSLIEGQPGLGVNALARAMDIRQTTASNLVRGLIDSALVAAQRGVSDRRRVELHILPAGEAVLRKAPGPFSGVLPAALARLDASALARLEADLARLIDGLHADASAGTVPLAQL